jgi:uncharacterized protein YndB with AHSA1/START domain
MIMENETKGLVITREFDAPLQKVWDAWTNPELIKKWWGPHGYSAPVINIDFKEGGKYLYCMRGPAGPGGPIVDAWSGGEFKEIVPLERIVITDYFADEKGNKTSPETFGLSPDFPVESTLTITFEEQAGKTLLTINYPMPEDEKAREAMIKSGMEEGWGQSLDKLAEAINEV